MAIMIGGFGIHMGATENRRQALEQLKSLPKFGPDTTTIYPGAYTENERIRLEQVINKLIDRLLSDNVETLEKRVVLEEFKTTLDGLVLGDSEDQDQVCAYLEKIMDIFQIQSSDGLLNKWRYGFDIKK